MAIDKIQNVIIGSGEGGKYLAWHLAGTGEQTVVIERRLIGGSCPNTNCLPSKNEISSAKVADLVHHAGRFGTRVDSFSIDIAAVRRRKREMVDGLIKMHLDKFKASGAELVMGSAKLTAPARSKCSSTTAAREPSPASGCSSTSARARRSPAFPAWPRQNRSRTSKCSSWIVCPAQLIVIGGGYVGLEFAQAYRRFGSRVTIVQHNAQLLAGEDADVAAEVRDILTAEGIEILTSAEMIAATGRSGSARQPDRANTRRPDASSKAATFSPPPVARRTRPASAWNPPASSSMLAAMSK